MSETKMDMIKVKSLYRQMLNATVLFHVYKGKEMISCFSEPQGEHPHRTVIWLGEYEDDDDAVSITEGMLNDAVISESGTTIRFDDSPSWEQFEIRMYLWQQITVKQEWLPNHPSTVMND
jgi:hypothetical protein